MDYKVSVAANGAGDCAAEKNIPLFRAGAKCLPSRETYAATVNARSPCSNMLRASLFEIFSSNCCRNRLEQTDTAFVHKMYMYAWRAANMANSMF